jgi:hypothetical protein
MQKNSVILSEGEREIYLVEGFAEPESKDLGGLDAEVHHTASSRCERAVSRLGME